MVASHHNPRIAYMGRRGPWFRRARLCLHAFRLDAPISPVEVKADVEIGTIMSHDRDKRAWLSPLLNQRLVEERFHRNEVCYYARADGRVVSYGWVSLGREVVEEVFLVVETQPGEAYIYDCFTVAEWRGKGLYPALLSRILCSLKEDGLRRALIFTLDTNASSRRGIEKAGFYQFQSVTCTRVLLWAFYGYGPKDPSTEADVSFLRWHA